MRYEIVAVWNSVVTKPVAETYGKTDDHAEFLAEVDKLRRVGWTILGTTTDEGIVTAWVTREGA